MDRNSEFIWNCGIGFLRHHTQARSYVLRFHRSELNNGSALENGNMSEACALVSSKVMAHVTP